MEESGIHELVDAQNYDTNSFFFIVKPDGKKNTISQG
jgi:hypothetical protein